MGLRIIAWLARWQKSYFSIMHKYYKIMCSYYANDKFVLNEFNTCDGKRV